MSTMSQMSTLILRALRCQYNIKFYSQPGLGKDTLLDAIITAEQANDPDFFYDVWDGGTASPTDTVMSMPDLETQTIRQFIRQGLPNAYKTPDLRGIIRVGELGLMGLETSKGFQKLWNHEDIGAKFRIPNGVIFVGLSNRLTDKSGVQQESRANGSRFESHVLEYEPEYALQVMKLYHERVAAFAIRNPSCIDNYTDVFESTQRNANDLTLQEGKQGIWANLRSWRRVSDKMVDAERTGIELLPDEISRNVGSGIAATFSAFNNMLDRLATLEEIIKEPAKVPVPSKMDEQYALSTMLALLVNKENFESIAVYLKRYSEEIQVVFFRLMNERLNKAKDKNTEVIKNSKTYKVWITSPHFTQLLTGASQA